ncbi:MAG: diacylglycerol kinase family protein [Candidatus Dormibacteraceae bacterium]
MEPDPERPTHPWNIIRSARDAYGGLWYALWRTRSLQLGVAATIVAVGVGWALGLSILELVLIIAGGTLLLAIETLNTAIEMLCDFVHSGSDPRVGRVKDVAAGATAWTEIGGVVGLLILYGARVWHLTGH